MINNDEIDNYNINKVYIPSDLYNSTWKYTLDNDTITIITNNNCTQNYNTVYCDCIRYNQKYNIKTKTYQCNANNINNQIETTEITQDKNYNERIITRYTQQYNIYFGIIITAILFSILLKRNSRNI